MPAEYVGGADYENPYIRLHNHGKIIEKTRDVFLGTSLDEVPIHIEDIIEIRIGQTTIRFLTEDNFYYMFYKEHIIYMEAEIEGGLQL